MIAGAPCAEVTAEDWHRIGAEPVVEHARVHRAEVRLESSRRRRCSRASGWPDSDRATAPCRRSRRGPAHPIAIMTAAGAVIGALAAVFEDATAELGELQHQRVVRAVPGCGGPCRTQRTPSPNVPIRLRVARRRRRFPWPACVSNPPVCTQNTRVPMPRDDRSSHGPQRQRESVVRIRHRRYVDRRPTPRDRAWRTPPAHWCSRTTDAADRPAACEAIRVAVARSLTPRRRYSDSRTRRSRAFGIAGTLTSRDMSARGSSCVVFQPESGSTGRHRLEVASQPARVRLARRIGRAPDVRALEMRAARVLIAGALHDRQAALVEDASQAGETRVQAERLAARVAADLQHLPGGTAMCGRRL